MPMNETTLQPISYRSMRSTLGWTAFALLLVAVALVTYFDDIQIVESSSQEIPTIYNTRIAGIKIIDAVSILLFAVVGAYLLVRGHFTVTFFHRQVGVIFLVYCGAALVGFVYSFFLRYDYAFWLRDFQQIIYMVGFFLLVFHVVDTMAKWKLFVSAFLIFLAAKNLLIFYRTFAGIGKGLGEWWFRASQNSEFAYFPMMFFPLLVILLKKCPRVLRIPIVAVLGIYLFNSLVGIYRTVWVMLLLGGVYLLWRLDGRGRMKLMVYGALGLGVTLGVVAAVFPRFVQLAWTFKFASIFDWSIKGDRSNATRTLEIINVTNYVFRHLAFLQGMGLGAWWDDSARRLLPDLGSGFTFKTRFYTTHMFFLTQLLKIGLVGLFFFWRAIVRMFLRVGRHVTGMSWNRWEKSVLLGLQIGLLCAFISSADFVRLFLVIGICLGLVAAFVTLDSTDPTVGSVTQPVGGA